MSKLTPWFPAHVKPSHIGVYETKSGWDSGPGPRFNFWDGSAWMGTSFSPEGARRESRECPADDLEWRGLAEEPKP